MKQGSIFDLAVSEYCKESEQDGFLFAPDRNGCSLEKSNGYNSGFLNGFEKGYLHQQQRIAELEAQIQQLEPKFTELEMECKRLKAELKRKDEALSYLLQGVKGLPPLTAIAGVLIDHCSKAEQALSTDEPTENKVKFTCYEINTVQSRMHGCNEQCDECKAEQALKPKTNGNSKK